MTHCTRCGKDNPAEIHTCTPLAMTLADALEKDKWHVSGVTLQEAADELRRLHAENEAAHAVGIRQERELMECEARIARSGVELQRAVLAEREACARVCDERAMKNEHACEGLDDEDATSLRSAAWQMSLCAAAIRARGAAPQQPEGDKP